MGDKFYATLYMIQIIQKEYKYQKRGRRSVDSLANHIQWVFWFSPQPVKERISSLYWSFRVGSDLKKKCFIKIFPQTRFPQNWFPQNKFPQNSFVPKICFLNCFPKITKHCVSITVMWFLENNLKKNEFWKNYFLSAAFEDGFRFRKGF